MGSRSSKIKTNFSEVENPTMTNTYSGSYPIERRDGEIERLHIQSAGMAPDTQVMLDLIGVEQGWKCLDLGCGPGGITSLLSERVGDSGHVLGLDMLAQQGGNTPWTTAKVVGGATELVVDAITPSKDEEESEKED